MRKSNFLTGGLFVLLAALMLLQDFACPHPAKDQLYTDLGDWLGEKAFRDRELDERFAGFNRFATLTDEVESDFVAGRFDLEDAVERIRRACQEHYPEFLDKLANVETGATAEERIARFLVHRVEENLKVRDDQDLRKRMQAQLSDMLKKRPKGMPPMVSMA